jgi:hypothetical protein
MMVSVGKLKFETRSIASSQCVSSPFHWWTSIVSIATSRANSTMSNDNYDFSKESSNQITCPVKDDS